MEQLREDVTQTLQHRLVRGLQSNRARLMPPGGAGLRDSSVTPNRAAERRGLPVSGGTAGDRSDRASCGHTRAALSLSLGSHGCSCRDPRAQTQQQSCSGHADPHPTALPTVSASSARCSPAVPRGEPAAPHLTATAVHVRGSAGEQHKVVT